MSFSMNISNNKNKVKIYFCGWVFLISLIFGLYHIYYLKVGSSKFYVPEINTRISESTTYRKGIASSKTINVPSDFCLSEIKAKINHQRGGWGNFTPGDLYEGAKEAFDLGLRDVLPENTPGRVLDIGCGFALYDNFLLDYYGYSENMHLYLLDKTTELKKEGFKGGGFREEGISFYTNLECASDILISNGADKNNIHTLEASEGVLSQLERSSFDLIFSLLSYGHHYPVSTYLEEINRILRKGGVLILDLRVIDGVIQGLKDLTSKGFRCEISRHRRRGKTVKCLKI